MKKELSIFLILLVIFIFHNSSQSLTVPETKNLGSVSSLVGGGKPPF